MSPSSGQSLAIQSAHLLNQLFGPSLLIWHQPLRFCGQGHVRESPQPPVRKQLSCEDVRTQSEEVYAGDAAERTMHEGRLSCG